MVFVGRGSAWIQRCCCSRATAARDKAAAVAGDGDDDVMKMTFAATLK